MIPEDDALWDPSGSPPDPELADLEARLLPFRHCPQPWSVEAASQRASASAAGLTEAGFLPGAADDERDESAEGPPALPRADETAGPAVRRSIVSYGGSRGLRLVSALAAAALLALLVHDGLESWSLDDETEPAVVSGVGPSGTPADEGYLVEALAGSPLLRREGSDDAVAGGRLAAREGDVLVCDAGSRADVHVAGAGRLRLEPDSRLRLERAPDEGWRLYLERGQLTASIFAAPRLFQVGTPAGIAVDLGCFYTATVGLDGSTTLSVRGGQVSFEVPGHRVLVPAGAEVVARPGLGPGTPCWADISPELKHALGRLDLLAQAARGRGGAGQPPAGACLTPEDRAGLQLLTSAGPEATRLVLSLWHLLGHPCPEVARAATEALARQCPPPATSAGEAPPWAEATREAWRQLLVQQGLW